MTLLFNLPNGEQTNLLGNAPDEMAYICEVGGEFREPITELLAAYKQAASWRERYDIEEKIDILAYYYVDALGAGDEELQQQISLDELAGQISQRLTTFANTME